LTNLLVGVKLVKSFIVQAPEQFENSKNYLFKLDNCKQIIWRRDIQHNDTHHNDINTLDLFVILSINEIQHDDTQHKS
jgi:hypothetical protein